MSDERVWLQHPEHEGYFHCPKAAVEDWQGMGWQVADAPPPEPISPVVAENIAAQQRASEAPAKTSRKGGTANTTTQEG